MSAVMHHDRDRQSQEAFDALMQDVAEHTRPGGKPTFIGALEALECIEAVTTETAQDIEALIGSAEILLRERISPNDPAMRLLSLALHKAVEMADTVNEQVVGTGAWTMSARTKAGH